jgi:hypothetical protein
MQFSEKVIELLASPLLSSVPDLLAISNSSRNWLRVITQHILFGGKLVFS